MWLSSDRQLICPRFLLCSERCVRLSGRCEWMPSFPQRPTLAAPCFRDFRTSGADRDLCRSGASAGSEFATSIIVARLSSHSDLPVLLGDIKLLRKGPKGAGFPAIVVLPTTAEGAKRSFRLVVAAAEAPRHEPALSEPTLSGGASARPRVCAPGTRPSSA